MKSATGLLALAGSLFAMVSVASADPSLFSAPTGNYLRCDSLPSASADDPTTYPFVFQTSLGAEAAWIGLGDPANVWATDYVDRAGVAKTLSAAYAGQSVSNATALLFGPVLLGELEPISHQWVRSVNAVRRVSDGAGGYWIIADFQNGPIPGQFTVGASDSLLYLDGQPGATGDVVMRVWGREGESAGFVQAIGLTTSDGNWPANQPTETGVRAAADSDVFWHGELSLGFYYDAGLEKDVPWTFSEDLFDHDFGANLSQLYITPEPGTLALLGLGGMVVAAMRRRRK